MTTKLVVLVLALSCVIQATHSLAIEEQLFNEHHLFDDLNLEDGPVGNVTLTKFTFDYTEEDKVYLIVCTNAEYASDTGPGTPTLIYTYPNYDPEANLPGNFTDDNKNCTKFDITRNLPDPQTSTTYVLVIPILTTAENSEERQEVSKTGNASFIYSVEGTLACSLDNALTRISWSDDEAIFEGCLNDVSVMPNVCYLEGDKTNDDVCFTTSQDSDMNICRKGVLTPLGDGTSAVNYISYDESSAQLSITSDDDQPVENYELTVWSSAENSNAIVTNCTKDPCDVSPTFTPGDLKYDMCVVARSNSTVQSSYTSIQDLTFATVRWLWTEETTTVQICANEDLPEGNPSFIYYASGASSATFEGTLDDDPKCANFTDDMSYPLPNTSITYQLMIVSDTRAPLGIGTSTFTVTVKTTLLNCGNLPLTKITWSNDEVLSADLSCLEGSDSFDSVCYHSEDLTGTEFCFTVEDDNGVNVNVCLTGPTDDTSLSEGEVLSANYLAYGTDGSATLSLGFGALVYDELRAIIRTADDPANPGTPGTATVFGCPGGICSIAAYEATSIKYEVCAEAINEGTTVQTNATTFTDMHLYTFDAYARAGTLVEFVFANSLDDMKYSANLYQELPPNLSAPLNTVNVDCTGVAAGHACFGFLDTSGVSGTMYVALSSQDGANTIIAPYETSTS